jgi:hypothetical protein
MLSSLSSRVQLRSLAASNSSSMNIIAAYSWTRMLLFLILALLSLRTTQGRRQNTSNKLN